MESGKIMEDPVLYNTDFHHISSSVSKMHFSTYEPSLASSLALILLSFTHNAL